MPRTAKEIVDLVRSLMREYRFEEPIWVDADDLRTLVAAGAEIVSGWEKHGRSYEIQVRYQDLRFFHTSWKGLFELEPHVNPISVAPC
jgi:hypothetical protein